MPMQASATQAPTMMPMAMDMGLHSVEPAAAALLPHGAVGMIGDVVTAITAEPGPPNADATTAESEEQAKKRARKSGAKVPRWTEEEEQVLRATVEEMGEENWGGCAEKLGTGRSGTGVEQHWQIMEKRRCRCYGVRVGRKPGVYDSWKA